MPDGLYDWIADQDCDYQPDDSLTGVPRPNGYASLGGLVPGESATFLGWGLQPANGTAANESLKQMHERIQAEQQAAYAAKANRENVKLLIAAMELKP